MTKQLSGILGLTFLLLGGALWAEEEPAPPATLEELQSAVLDLMEAYGFPPREWISEIRVDHPDSLVVYLLQDGTPVRVGTGRMSRTKVQALLVTIDELAKEGSKPEYIDLRFVDQVVVGGAG